jgi:diguanylate cyclase (GGDEF)-like protein
MPETRETLAGRTVLAQRLGAAGINIIEHDRYPRLHGGTYFSIGNNAFQTDISLSDEFLSDLPNTKEYQQAVDTYAQAVAGRGKYGSPDVFCCRSGIAVRISIQWPIQSAVANGVFSSFISFDATNTLDRKIARCSMDKGHTLGHTVFDTLVETVNSLRAAIDDGMVAFYPPDVHQEVFQRIERQQKFTASSQEEVEQFLKGKAYLLGFFAVDQPTEVWTADPWDAHYLGVSTKELLLAMRVLRARGLFESGSSHEYARPTDKLLAEQSAKEDGDEASFPAYGPVSLEKLPKKGDLLDDLQKVLKHHSVSALLVIDLDHFKTVNDTKGHPAGDACLEQVVRTLASVVGRKGKLYRWGGDEFAFVLPDFSTAEAQITAERIRIEVEAAKPGGDAPVTTSIGVCASDRAGTTSAKEILEFADKAMYESKRSGKNRVTIWPIGTNVAAPVSSAKSSKQAIKAQLTEFLKQAREIQSGLHYSNSDSLRQKRNGKSASNSTWKRISMDRTPSDFRTQAIHQLHFRKESTRK